MQRSKKIGFLESPEAKMFVTMSFPPCGRQTLQCHLGDTDDFSWLSYAGPGFWQVLHLYPLGWQLMSWMVWNSFDKQDVKGHYDAGNCNSSMQPGSNHSSFVKYTPNSLLLWKQPGFETRYFLEVGTGANKEQTKHQNPIQGVHVRHGGSARPGWGVRVQL